MPELLKPIVTFLVLSILFTLIFAECGCSVSQQVRIPRDSYLLVTHHVVSKKCVKKLCVPHGRTRLGSGFVIAASGGNSWGMTAGHLCMIGADTITSELKVVSTGGAKYSAEVAQVLGSVDLCVFVIRGVLIPPVAMAKIKPTHGERVFALSSPSGIYDVDLIPMFEGFYSGVTTGVPDPYGGGGYFPSLDAYTIPSRPGSSGGPVFNDKGEIIGVIIMARPDFESFTLSPPLEAVSTVIGAVKAGIKAGAK